MKKIIWILILMFSCMIVYGQFWTDDPSTCPATDAGEFPGQDCTPNNICGDDGGIAQCYDTSTLVAPTPYLSTTSWSGSFDGGFLVNCFATADGSDPQCDNGGVFWCDRNSSHYNSPVRRQTNCTDFGTSQEGLCRSGYWDCYGDTNCESTSTSDCSNCAGSCNNKYDTDTCTTGFEGSSGVCECDAGAFECDGTINDADGCEWVSGSSCGDSTGTIQFEECVDVSTANCTQTGQNYDCYNNDGDNNNLTCNAAPYCNATLFVTEQAPHSVLQVCTEFDCEHGWFDCDGSGTGDDANGCETQNNSACTIGPVSGTYLNGCTCIVSDVDIATSGVQVVWSGTDAFLSLWMLGAGPVVNFTNSRNISFIINDTGAFWNNQAINETGGGVPGGTTPHTLNGSNHTGDLSAGRVIKDTGTYWLSEYLPNIFDQIWERDVQINSTFASYSLTTDIKDWIAGNRTQLIGYIDSNSTADRAYTDTRVESVGNWTFDPLDFNLSNSPVVSLPTNVTRHLDLTVPYLPRLKSGGTLTDSFIKSGTAIVTIVSNATLEGNLGGKYFQQCFTINALAASAYTDVLGSTSWTCTSKNCWRAPDDGTITMITTTVYNSLGSSGTWRFAACVEGSCSSTVKNEGVTPKTDWFAQATTIGREKGLDFNEDDDLMVYATELVNGASLLGHTCIGGYFDDYDW